MHGVVFVVQQCFTFFTVELRVDTQNSFGDWSVNSKSDYGEARIPIGFSLNCCKHGTQVLL